MNRTLVEHWEKHGLARIGEGFLGGWCWTNKGCKLDSAVLGQLERFELGNPVDDAMRHQMRDAGFDHLTCMLSDTRYALPEWRSPRRLILERQFPQGKWLIRCKPSG